MASTITSSMEVKIRVAYKNTQAGVITHTYTNAGGTDTSETF